MKNRETLPLMQPIEGVSTGYDHFRHVYGFVKELYNAIYSKQVDYDQRERETITEDNFSQKQIEFREMIQRMLDVTESTEMSLTATKTYPDFQSHTSLSREIIAVLQHADNHYHYIHPLDYQKSYDQHYIINKESTKSLQNIQDIKNDICKDQERYASLVTYVTPYHREEYALIEKKLAQLQDYNTDDHLIFQSTITSVSNEYYKIEEELVHLLYDIRLYLKHHHDEQFNLLINQDPHFGIARSTIVSL